MLTHVGGTTVVSKTCHVLCLHGLMAPFHPLQEVDDTIILNTACHNSKHGHSLVRPVHVRLNKSLRRHHPFLLRG